MARTFGGRVDDLAVAAHDFLKFLRTHLGGAVECAESPHMQGVQGEFPGVRLRVALPEVARSCGDVGIHASGLVEPPGRDQKSAMCERQSRVFLKQGRGEETVRAREGHDPVTGPHAHATGSLENGGDEIRVFGRGGVAHRIDDGASSRQGLGQTAVDSSKAIWSLASTSLVAVLAQERMQLQGATRVAGDGYEESVKCWQTL